MKLYCFMWRKMESGLIPKNVFVFVIFLFCNFSGKLNSSFFNIYTIMIQLLLKSVLFFQMPFITMILSLIQMVSIWNISQLPWTKFTFTELLTRNLRNVDIVNLKKILWDTKLQRLDLLKEYYLVSEKFVHITS